MRNRAMASKFPFRAAVLAGLIALASVAAVPAGAGEPPAPKLVGDNAATRFVPLGVGKSTLIDLPRDAKEVLVADPTIANAIVRTARRAYLIGVKVGQTNIFFFDAEGRQITALDVAVTRDLNGIRAALKRVLPHSDVKVEGLGAHSVVISGTVDTPHDAQLGYQLACNLLAQAPGSTTTFSGTGAAGGAYTGTTSTTGGSPGNGGDCAVVNAIVVRGRDQVMLKVTVAEVQRDVIKQLGIDLNGALNYGSATLNFLTNNPFSVAGQALSNTFIAPQGADNPSQGFLPNIGATIRAMERAGVIRTLAEPNLTAISGEGANFLAGGEFPIPSGYTCDPVTRSCQLGITFKKFGVGLNFTPVVLSEGRISLKVMTEVSELSNEGALTLAQSISATQTSSVTIPSIKTRRAETTVEIPSGGSLAMAGMIQEQTKQQINGLPGLMQLPVLGALFKSRDYLNRQTELMVLVTPYVVRSVSPKDLSRPDDGFVDATDPATVLLGRLNRIYGTTGKIEPGRSYHGSYGFILD
jgi:pilus assembly protein CpaC